MSTMTSEQEKLQKQFQKLNAAVSDDIYDQRKYLFGRVSTIFEAVLSDNGQLKAAKDMLSEVVYGGDPYARSRNEIISLAKANGFELYDEDSKALASPKNQYEI